jgi:hypothetical protein
MNIIPDLHNDLDITALLQKLKVTSITLNNIVVVLVKIIEYVEELHLAHGLEKKDFVLEIMHKLNTELNKQDTITQERITDYINTIGSHTIDMIVFATKGKLLINTKKSLKLCCCLFNKLCINK